MAKLTEEQINLLKKEMIRYISLHIQQNPEVIDAIAQDTGLFSLDILKAINSDTGDFKTIADIYASHRKFEEAHKQEKSDLDEIDGEKVAEQVSRIKSYLKSNPTEVFDLTKECGLSPQEIVNLINTENPDPEKIGQINAALDAIMAPTIARCQIK